MPSLFKSTIEPAIIVSTFTIGTFINRRRRPHGVYLRHDIEQTPHPVEIELDGGSSGSGSGSQSDSASTTSESESSSLPSPSGRDSPLLKPALQTKHAKLKGKLGRPPPNLVLDLLGRAFHKFPFLAEIWYWLLTYWVYQLLRAFSARMIAGNVPVFERARQHALQILHLEHALGLDVELAFQRYILTAHPGLMPHLARIYHSHICVGVAFLVYMYTFTPRRVFARFRRALALDNAIAFVLITAWRCAPPRLLPATYGFEDVLHRKSAPGAGNAWTNNRFQLTVAAMPSLHFGTSLLLAVCAARFSPHRAVRWLAVLWPVGMLVTIVATANHFLADAAVGALIPYVGWRYGHVLLRLKPVQDWVFGPVRRRMEVLRKEEEEEEEE